MLKRRFLALSLNRNANETLWVSEMQENRLPFYLLENFFEYILNSNLSCSLAFLTFETRYYIRFKTQDFIQ